MQWSEIIQEDIMWFLPIFTNGTILQNYSTNLNPNTAIGTIPTSYSEFLVACVLIYVCTFILFYAILSLVEACVSLTISYVPFVWPYPSPSTPSSLDLQPLATSNLFSIAIICFFVPRILYKWNHM